MKIWGLDLSNFYSGFSEFIMSS